jgi:PIN domain nuclease of toxin-antitoxin system
VRILLDTHAVLWAAENDARLGSEAAAFIRACQPGDVVMSDLTLLEIAMLVKKRRVSLNVPLRDYLRGLQSTYPVLAIDADIAAIAMVLDLPGADPFDRVIVATALHHELPLATRDRVIADAKLLRTIW